MIALPRRDERGVSAIEFALVFPLIFMLRFGIVQYSLYFWGRETAAASAREAARRLAVGTDWGCTQSEALTQVNEAGRGPAVTMRYANAGNSATVGTFVEVTVSMSSVAPTLLPVPDGGAITEMARSRVENIPAQPLTCS